jgi:cytochrome b561
MAAHEFVAYLLVSLVALHAAAALFHHFVRRDNVLKAMLPGLRR